MSIYERYHRALLGHVSISPEACGALAVGLEEALAPIQSWDIRTPASSPTGRAIVLLRQVANRGAYGSTERELRLTGAAIRLAHNFLHIGSILPVPRQEQMAEQLGHALGGVLGNAGRSARAMDVQTQFWFGAWLAQAGLHPGIPEAGTRPLPDYLISVDTLQIAVEVKRLQSLNTLRDRVEEAGEQLARPRWPGIIALDVTGCLDGIDQIGFIDRDRTIRNRLWRSYGDTISLVERHVTSLTYQEPFAGLVLLVCFAHFYVWDDTPALRPHLGFDFTLQAYPRACSGLIGWQVARVGQRLIDALPRMGVERARIQAVPA